MRFFGLPVNLGRFRILQQVATSRAESSPVCEICGDLRRLRGFTRTKPIPPHPQDSRETSEKRSKGTRFRNCEQDQVIPVTSIVIQLPGIPRELKLNVIRDRDTPYPE